MSRIWKIILIAALVLAVIGAAAAAVGYFTGASVERMIEILFGGRETLELILQILKQELGAILN